MKRWHIILVRLAILALVLGAWEVLPRAGFVNPMLLPPLSEVVVMLQTQIARPAVQEAMKLLEQNPVKRVPRPAPIDRVSGRKSNGR